MLAPYRGHIEVGHSGRLGGTVLQEVLQEPRRAALPNGWKAGGWGAAWKDARRRAAWKDTKGRAAWREARGQARGRTRREARGRAGP